MGGRLSLRRGRVREGDRMTVVFGRHRPHAVPLSMRSRALAALVERDEAPRESDEIRHGSPATSLCRPKFSGPLLGGTTRKARALGHATTAANVILAPTN
jgi:hypothetical protein